MKIDFGAQKYDKVSVWILKIKDDSDYKVPSSGTLISSLSVDDGIK